jgi:hypothetical protein
MIDHVETLLAAGIVDRGDVGEVDETQRGIVAQVLHHLDDLARIDRDGELVERDRMGEAAPPSALTIVCPRASSLPSSIT